ncbi:MAG: glycine--tRNA ligase subunit beta [Acidobacteria bacterium]|jgi:glycyl-tRNA synthetase beta chain|nr:glycine--tRNA ligase subunit beta [Acidobacteriota bacterium]
MATFLLEIRTEEIPAAALPGARRQLDELFAAQLTEAGYSDFEIAALSTSRRLAVVVENLPGRQAERTEEVTGPPAKVAVDAEGKPTPAGEGFARKVGLPFDEVGRIETAKGEYLTATVVHEGRPTAEILAEIVPAVVGALRFPKMMRWGDGTNVFVRPVHGIVALLDCDVVACEIFGVTAGRSTVGHRVHSPESFELETADGYVDALMERSVVVDSAARQKRLAELSARLASEAGARVHPDPQLMAEHVELVEWPGLISGSFEERFLELPPEVVVTTLRHHQKCLILENTDNGGLQNAFIGVIDRKDDPEGLIRQGNEWVIGARLADARFFFSEDRKRSLHDLVPNLGRLEFHRVLGSLGDKALRVGDLAVNIANLLQSEIDPDRLRASAGLAKADLLSHMVAEFPSLQGIMGGHYLRLEGADEDLWTAVRDHYLPVGFEGKVPESVAGKLLAVADRLDTVAGLFAVGENPTGSKDPFGLRRAAQGAIKIVAEAGWEIDLDTVIGNAVDNVANYSEEGTEAVSAAVTAFLEDRVRRWLIDTVGVSFDTADAVMAADWSNLPAAIVRAQALEKVRTSENFRQLALAFKRVRNITEEQPDRGVDPGLFEMDEERELYDAAVEFANTLQRYVPKGEVEQAFAAMEPITDILERFFVEVLVMCEDERVRDNRIALLMELGRHFMKLADLSKLQVEGGE